MSGMRHVNVRMTLREKAALEALAEAENRSLNNMIITLIGRAAGTLPQPGEKEIADGSRQHGSSD